MGRALPPLSLSHRPPDDVNQLARPNWLHQCLVRIGPAARHLEQVAAHHDSLRAKFRGGIGDKQAAPIGQPQSAITSA